MLVGILKILTLDLVVKGLLSLPRLAPLQGFRKLTVRGPVALYLAHRCAMSGHRGQQFVGFWRAQVFAA